MRPGPRSSVWPAPLRGVARSLLALCLALCLALVLAMPTAATATTRGGDLPPDWSPIVDATISRALASRLSSGPPRNPFGGAQPPGDLPFVPVLGVGRLSVSADELLPLLLDQPPSRRWPGFAIDPTPDYFALATEIEAVTVLFDGDPLDCDLYCEVALVEDGVGAVGLAPNPQLPDFLEGATAFSSLYDDGTLQTAFGQATADGGRQDFANPYGILRTDLTDGKVALTWLTPGPQPLRIAVSGLTRPELDAAWVSITEPIPVDTGRSVLGLTDLDELAATLEVEAATALRTGETPASSATESEADEAETTGETGGTGETADSTAASDPSAEADDAASAGSTEQGTTADESIDPTDQEVTGGEDGGNSLGLILLVGLLAVGALGLAAWVWTRLRGGDPGDGPTAGPDESLAPLLETPEERAKDRLFAELEAAGPPEVDWGGLDVDEMEETEDGPEAAEDEDLALDLTALDPVTAAMAGEFLRYQQAAEILAGAIDGTIELAERELAEVVATGAGAARALLEHGWTALIHTVGAIDASLAGGAPIPLAPVGPTLAQEAAHYNATRTPEEVATGFWYTPELLAAARDERPAAGPVAAELDWFLGLRLQAWFVQHLVEDVVSFSMVDRIATYQQDLNNPFRTYRWARGRIDDLRTMTGSTIDGWATLLSNPGAIGELDDAIGDAAEGVKQELYRVDHLARTDNRGLAHYLADKTRDAGLDAVAGAAVNRVTGRAPDVPDGPGPVQAVHPDAPDAGGLTRRGHGPDHPATTADGPGATRPDSPGERPSGFTRPDGDELDVERHLQDALDPDPHGFAPETGPGLERRSFEGWVDYWNDYIDRHFGGAKRGVGTAEPVPGTVPVAPQLHVASCAISSLHSALRALGLHPPSSLTIRIIARRLGIWRGTGFHRYDIKQLLDGLTRFDVLPKVRSRVFRLRSGAGPYQSMVKLLQRYPDSEFTVRLAWPGGGGHIVRVESIGGGIVQLSDPILPLNLSLRVPAEVFDGLASHATRLTRVD